MVHTKRRLGQHLLAFTEDAEAIARLAHVSPGVSSQGSLPLRLLEIGPGSGELTAALLAEFPQIEITAVEFDRYMVSHLQRRFAAESRLHVEQLDILQYEIPEDQAPLTVLGNLPYNMSSPILAWTVSNCDKISQAVYMLQREVAERLVSSPDSKNWSPLAIFTQLRFSAEICLKLGPERFSPPPKVDSAVVKLIRRDLLDCEPPSEFYRVVRSAFTTRRKTLMNNLISGLSLSRSFLSDVLDRLSLDQRCRAEQLTVRQFLDLTRELGI